MIRIELPYPPSLNNYWRHVGPRVLISRPGRSFRNTVRTLLAAAGIRPMAGFLAVTIELHPPDRRKRDIDNIQKSLLDALEKGGAFYDDCQVKKLTTVMLEPIPGGNALVQIEEMKT